MTILEMSIKIAVKVSALGLAPVETALDSINHAIKYLALKLADRNSDLARGTFNATVARSPIMLPEDFNGFYGKPTIDSLQIEPVPLGYDANTDPGTPKYYEVVDDMLYLYPTPASLVTLQSQYWVFPADLTTNDYTPYAGKFDGLITSMATRICSNGFDAIVQQAFIAEVENGLDLVLFPRRPALPANRPFNHF